MGTRTVILTGIGNLSTWNELKELRPPKRMSSSAVLRVMRASASDVSKLPGMVKNWNPKHDIGVFTLYTRSEGEACVNVSGFQPVNQFRLGDRMFIQGVRTALHISHRSPAHTQLSVGSLVDKTVI